MVQLIAQYHEQLINGFFMTVKLSVGSLLGSLIPGLVLVVLMLSRWNVTRRLGRFLIAVFRNVPSLVQLFMIYYLLPPALHIKLSPFWSAVVAFILNGSGYVAEILRSGIEGVPKGQWEAARALGIRGFNLYRRIILPQAAILIIGPFMNEVTRQIKSSSLASTIAVQDLMYVTSSASSDTFAPTIFFTVGAALYFIIIFPIGVWSRYLERRTVSA